MANDPHRDLLPVKEEHEYKADKAFTERIDYQILAKLPRCELEDRFLRLLDEKIQLKKLINCQEEKIKRLGTKLLRLINEKKDGKKYLEQNKETEDLHLKIIELEHENYALKDKNIVLKQQLANHSRHIKVHSSPVRSNHSSPLMSMRQVAPQLQREVTYDSTNKNITAEAQLQAAEAHIKELNKEMKSLHIRIDYLQQNLEKNSLDGRKTKVTENIELIRLQRSLKQQAIQIAALQAQVKSYENGQKLLKEELIKAHNENDEALHLLAVKQNEILNLCSKLEEKNLNKLQEDELRERIKDLISERNSLKERSDFLMSTIGTKAEEIEQIKVLKKSLEEERQKNEKLEEALQAAQILIHCTKSSDKAVVKASVCHQEKIGSAIDIASEVRITHTKNENRITDKTYDESKGHLTHSLLGEVCEAENDIESLREYLSPICKCTKNYFLNPELENTDLGDKAECKDTDRHLGIHETKYYVEKIKLERELQCLREMLRSQTSRCEAQQAEISRLMCELRVNEEKCNDTLRRLDLHLKIFQNLETRTKRDSLSPSNPEPVLDKAESFIKLTENFESQVKSTDSRENVISNSKYSKNSISPDDSFKHNSRQGSFSIESVNSKNRKPGESVPKKRFVEQVFLESSDEENVNEKSFGRESFIRKLEELEQENTVPDSKKKAFDGSENKFRSGSLSNSPLKVVGNPKRRFSSGSLTSKQPSNLSTQSQIKYLPKRQHKDFSSPELKSQLSNKSKENDTFRVQQEVVITILWLKVESSGSLWKNNQVKLLFVEFSFLNVKGEETETPNSLRKPENPDEKLYFNFSKRIEITENARDKLKLLLDKPDLDLVIFKVVSEPEDSFDNTDCEDVGVAVVTVQQFIEKIGQNSFQIEVKNTENIKEVVGTLAVSVDASPGIF